MTRAATQMSLEDAMRDRSHSPHEGHTLCDPTHVKVQDGKHRQRVGQQVPGAGRAAVGEELRVGTGLPSGVIESAGAMQWACLHNVHWQCM